MICCFSEGQTIQSFASAPEKRESVVESSIRSIGCSAKRTGISQITYYRSNIIVLLFCPSPPIQIDG